MTGTLPSRLCVSSPWVGRFAPILAAVDNSEFPNGAAECGKGACSLTPVDACGKLIFSLSHKPLLGAAREWGIERLAEEKQSIAADIKEVFGEAKGNGFDVRALRAIIKLRSQDAGEREAHEAILETYCQALGML